MIAQAFRLEFLTLAWMTIEALVAIISAIAADSLTLMAFGIDSLIELASAAALIWRLTVELKRGQSFAEGTERTASRISAVLLFALAAYVVVSAGWKLWTRRGADFSVPGLAIAVLAFRSCTSSRGANCRSPTLWAAARCGRTLSKASLAVGFHWWSSWRLWHSSPQALGGWTP
jgi:hypothetical protein